MKKRVIVIILAAAALICLGIFIFLKISDNNKKSSAEEVVEIAHSTTTKETTSEDTTKEAVEIPINFDSLKEINPDCYAWITITGTGIDCPIVQGDTDDYYLEHNFYKQDDPYGTIYTDSWNSKDFNDPLTLIFGHRLTNDSEYGFQFSQLHQYYDLEFFENHREIIIYLPDKILHYKIFAAFEGSNENPVLNYDLTDPTTFQSYIDSIFAVRDTNAHIDTTMTVTSEDKIISLYTCLDNGDHSKRYIVSAVLEEVEE